MLLTRLTVLNRIYRVGGWAQYYRFTPANASERITLQNIYDADHRNLNRYESSMRTAKSRVDVVELRGADHYVYFTNEAAVLRELRRFVAHLD